MLEDAREPFPNEETAMSATPAKRRHALGLPAGSIRALLALSVLGLLWALALKYPQKLPPEFVYLLLLKGLILVHYFSAHGKSMGTAVSERHALGLPRGSIRLLLMVGFLGLMAFLWNNATKLDVPEGEKIYRLFALLLGGFFVGYLVTAMFRDSNGHVPAWLQDVQAWLALLATVGLVVLVIVYAVINPSLAEQQHLNVEGIEAGLAGLVGFYFGARS
jgi:hypothetical protein